MFLENCYQGKRGFLGFTLSESKFECISIHQFISFKFNEFKYVKSLQYEEEREDLDVTSYLDNTSQRINHLIKIAGGASDEQIARENCDSVTSFYEEQPSEDELLLDPCFGMNSVFYCQLYYL